MKTVQFPDIGFPRDATGRPRPRMEAFEIEAISQLLRSFVHPVRALEWGCGVSTVYYFQRLPYGSSWDSIEHVADWHRVMTEVLDSLGNPAIRLHLVPPDGECGQHEEGWFHNFRSYIMRPTKIADRYDLILVDGRARVECMAVGWDLLADDGIMILHDAQREEFSPGIPRGCSYVRLTAREPTGLREIPSLLFMGKSAALLRSLLTALRRHQWDLAIEDNLGHAPPSHRILFVNTYYTGFLASLYEQCPELAALPYWQQKRVVQEQCFGDSDFYSAGMQAVGWDADDCVANCTGLQLAWARDHGISGQDARLLLREQVRRYEPDVLYLQDLSLADRELLELLRPHTRLIAGQIASPLPPQADLAGIDLLFSSFPHFVEEFRTQGKAAWYQPLAFEPRVLQRMPAMDRVHPITFVGGISGHHGKGLETLQAIAEEVPFEIWGYGAQSLPPESALRRHHHGEAWGLEMFAILRQSAITLNRHIDVARDCANNMRLFEATGCGALLITDYRHNLNELFEIGAEVVAYRSPEEAAALIRYYRANPAEAAAIAAAGQQRTLRDHTYIARMAQTAEILSRHLRYQREQGRYPMPHTISGNYRSIDPAETTEAMTQGWKDETIPALQRGLVQHELADMYAGQVRSQFLALAELLRPFVHDGSTILELGCASGYYYEILEYLLGKRINYTGVDYSEAMIAMARDFYPRPNFFAADGKALFFADRSFDVVISSSVLLHVPNYRQHIEETCRVARDMIVAHRTPVCRREATKTMAKHAYGVETVEFCFNEAELLGHFARQGFYPAAYVEISADLDRDNCSVSYLLRRKV